jgi:hypothetical protein
MILLSYNVIINYLLWDRSVLVSPLSGVGVVYPVLKKSHVDGHAPVRLCDRPDARVPVHVTLLEMGTPHSPL